MVDLGEEEKMVGITSEHPVEAVQSQVCRISYNMILLHPGNFLLYVRLYKPVLAGRSSWPSRGLYRKQPCLP
jgi:hypothetical protein